MNIAPNATSAHSGTERNELSLSAHKALLIDDNIEFCSLLTEYMNLHAFELVSVHTAAEGAEILRKETFEVILLDLMLPDANGMELLKTIRTVLRCKTPVIILSAHNEEADRIVSLELGADDYVPKTFSSRELLARMNAAIRRTNSYQESAEDAPGVSGALKIYPMRRQVFLENRPISLTSMEFRILYQLASQPGRIFSRDELMELLSKRTYSKTDRSIDVHISSIRNKLGDIGAVSKYIFTVRGSGYTFIGQSVVSE